MAGAVHWLRPFLLGYARRVQISRRQFIYSTTAAALLMSARAGATASQEPQKLAPPVPLAELETPALLLDEAAFTRNIEKMAAHLGKHKVGLRPHAKTHKSSAIDK